MAKRIPEFDIMKGVLIILVVVGHAVAVDSPVKWVVSWFHVSAFFMVSGVFLRAPERNPLTDKSFYAKTLSRYLLPMCLWLGITYLMAGGDFAGFQRMLVPYWFIRALIVGHVCVTLIDWWAKRTDSYQNMVILYLFLVWSAIHLSELMGMHRCQQVLAGVVFVGIGQLWAEWIKQKAFLTLATLFAMGYLMWSLQGHFPVYMNVAEGALFHFAFDFVVPVSFATVTYLLAAYLAVMDEPVLPYVGKASLAIFYIHIPVLYHTYGLPTTVRIALAVLAGVTIYFLLTTPHLPARKLRGVLARCLLGLERKSKI